MNTVTVNGKTYTIDSQSTIAIVGNRVIIHGDSDHAEFEIDTKKIEIVINGTLNQLNCDDSVTIKDGIVNNVNAKGSVNCDDVSGDVTAGGSVNCDDIEGNVSAGGSVNADCIKGNVSAGGSIRM